MFTKPGLSVLCLLIILAGCGSNSGVSPSSTPSAEQTAASPAPSATASATANPLSAVPSNNPSSAPDQQNACALIEKSEIAALQGAEVQSTIPTSQKKDKLAISQCYFSVTSADGSKNLSVHLQVLKSDPKDPDAAKEYWERTFDDNGERKEKGKEREEEREGGKPESIRGIGAEAFWIANPKFGVLYAFQKGTIARISIGGPDNEKTRLEKSKTLMAKVLKRIT
jgi:hypothetical protein